MDNVYISFAPCYLCESLIPTELSNDSQKRRILALCFFPWARVDISRLSLARRVKKRATIKFNQWFIYKLFSYVQTSVKHKIQVNRRYSYMHYKYENDADMDFLH